MIARVEETGEFVAHVDRAESFWQRFRGLMGTRQLDADRGLLFPRTNSIHTFFMRYPINVVYLDRTYQVLRVDLMKPWRVGPIVWKAYWVLEVPHVPLTLTVGRHVNIAEDVP